MIEKLLLKEFPIKKVLLQVMAGIGLLVSFSQIVSAKWMQTNGQWGGVGFAAMAVMGNTSFAGIYGGGIFLSTNGGISWTSANSGLTNKYTNAFEVSGSNIFVGTDGGGVFLSTNNGTNWTAVNSGLPDSASVWSFSVRGSNIFAGT